MSLDSFEECKEHHLQTNTRGSDILFCRTWHIDSDKLLTFSALPPRYEISTTLTKYAKSTTAEEALDISTAANSPELFYTALIAFIHSSHLLAHKHSSYLLASRTWFVHKLTVFLHSRQTFATAGKCWHYLKSSDSQGLPTVIIGAQTI
jgi:hypothetical protein